jgi:hypothetical protein
MVTVYEDTQSAHPFSINVEKILSPKLDLDNLTRKLEEWADRASAMYHEPHDYRVETDPAKVRRILEETEFLFFDKIQKLCFDNETATIYYNGRGPVIHILALHGYTLVE